MKNGSARRLACVPLWLFGAGALAQTSVPHDFQAGQPARASEVNENFDALEAAIDQNAGELEQIQGTTGLSREAKQIQTAFDLTSGIRWLIADHYRSTGRYPPDLGSVGATRPEDWSNKFVQDASIRPDGEISIYFRADAAPGIANTYVFLVPVTSGSGITWFDCTGNGNNDVFVAELDCTFSDLPYEPQHRIQQQVLTAFDLLEQSDARQIIQDFYNTNGYWPINNADAGLGAPNTYQNRYITELTLIDDDDFGYSGFAISMTFGKSAAQEITGNTIIWRPITYGNSIEWECDGGIGLNTHPIYLPIVCR